MKCSECFKKLENGETIYLSKDMSDCNSYCEKCKPEKSIPVLMEKAVPILGRRRGGGEYTEEIPKLETEIINKQEVVIETGEIIEEVEFVEEPEVIEPPAIIIEELPELGDKDITITQKAIVTFTKFEEYKKIITENAGKYKTLVMTSEDQYGRFKSDRAQMNKDKKMLSDVRIATKKGILESYDLLETQINELTTIIDGAKENIETQLNTYEMKLKNKKKEDIEKEFVMFQEEYPQVDFLELKSIFDQKWLNTGFKIKKIIKILEDTFIKLNDDIELIKLDENGARIKTLYLKNGFKLAEAKTSVLQSITHEKEEQAKIDAAMEENNLKVEDVIIEKVKEEVKKEIRVSKGSQATTVSSKITMKFAVTGDREILKDIVAYMKDKDVKIENLGGN